MLDDIFASLYCWFNEPERCSERNAVQQFLSQHSIEIAGNAWREVMRRTHNITPWILVLTERYSCSCAANEHAMQHRAYSWRWGLAWQLEQPRTEMAQSAGQCQQIDKLTDNI